MLSITLNTNEVKGTAAVEREFQRIRSSDRAVEYALITEAPSLPYRLSVSHQEVGKGMKARRRSVIRVDKTSLSGVDTVTPITTSAYIVLDAPVGAMTTIAEATEVLTNVMSFVGTNASATLLYDGTGIGAAALLSGGL